MKEGTFEKEFEVEKVLDVRGTPDERFYHSGTMEKLKGGISHLAELGELENAMDEIDDFWETTSWDRGN